MRHVILIVVLVGAAFLGGAFVNGPGLRWVQTQVLGSLGLDEGGEIATVDLKVGPSPEKAGDRAVPGESTRGPVTRMPGAAGDSTAKAPASGRRPGRPDDSEVADNARPQGSASALAPQLLPALTAPTDAPPPPDDPRAREVPPSSPVAGAARALRDPDVSRAAAPPASPSGSSAPPTSADRGREGDREARPALMDSLASLVPTPAPAQAAPEGFTPPAPKPAPAPSPSPVPSSPSPAPGRPGDEDWATLARKMQVLGISRFTIEGQPGSRVVFSCLIPLAGRQAVAQRFEAEGDDALQAARAALRRVALWRAAQPQPQQQPSQPR